MEKQHEATITLTYTQLFQLRCALSNRIVKAVTTTPFEEHDDYYQYILEEMMDAHKVLDAEVDRLGGIIDGETVTEFVTNLDQTISEILK